jgi:CRISPR system Cascade subunit CasA
MYNLLDDALIDVRRGTGPSRVDLPGLIAGLLDGSVLECTALRAHQADPWHVLLVQLAASVMARNPELADAPCDPAFWRDRLLELADGERSAWELVVEDVTKPAFLQHPLPDASALDAFKPTAPKARTPDELDVLVTAKDHDVKAARIRSDDPQAWLFALVAFQTTSGYLGAGNYGSIRMNGGYGSRSIVSLVASDAVPARFVEELRVVRSMRADTLAGGLGYVDRGIVLTWISPWDRQTSQFPIHRLEPSFIEAVRPVRLVHRDGGIAALGASAHARQIGPKTLDGGDVADPWTAINVVDKKKGRSALTVGEAGWTADLIARLLFQRDVETTALQRPRKGMSGTAWLVGTAQIVHHGEIVHLSLGRMNSERMRDMDGRVDP